MYVYNVQNMARSHDATLKVFEINDVSFHKLSELPTSVGDSGSLGLHVNPPYNTLCGGIQASSRSCHLVWRKFTCTERTSIREFMFLESLW